MNELGPTARQTGFERSHLFVFIFSRVGGGGGDVIIFCHTNGEVK